MVDFRLPGDEAAFGAINGLGWPWVDAVLVAASARWFSLGALLVVLGWLWWARRRWAPLLAVLLALALTDVVGGQVLKPWIARQRPFEVLPPARVRLLSDMAPGNGAMPSLHAANAFAVAAGAGVFLPGSLLATLPLAALVALSRVGVGVHWPSDVLAGALYGALVGLAVSGLVRRSWRTSA